MPRRIRPFVRCPRAREDDPHSLPPGIRYCMCDETADAVGQVLIEQGQLFWHVLGAQGHGWYSYVAVMPQGGLEVPIELEGDAPVVAAQDGDRVVYRVRAKRDGGELLINAAELVYAAAEGRETVRATPVDAAR